MIARVSFPSETRHPAALRGKKRLIDSTPQHSPEGTLAVVNEILAQVREDENIGVLVLGAAPGKKGPGPLVNHLSRGSGSLPIPVTIVPGDLSKERLEEIT